MIELITLDLDNTLWDVDAVIIQAEKDMRAWMAGTTPEAHAVYAGEALDTIRQEVFAEHAAMRHDLTFMRVKVLEQVYASAGYTARESEGHANAAFDIFFEGRNRVKFFPGAHEMLEALAEKYHLYALTNGNADIEKAGLGAYLDGAFSSADVGTSKPHADMFHAPLTHLNLQPGQAVHIGDNLVDDVHGANAVGMRTIWVNLREHERDADDPVPDHEVPNLASIVPLLESLG